MTWFFFSESVCLGGRDCDGGCIGYCLYCLFFVLRVCAGPLRGSHEKSATHKTCVRQNRPPPLNFPESGLVSGLHFARFRSTLNGKVGSDSEEEKVGSFLSLSNTHTLLHTHTHARNSTRAHTSTGVGSHVLAAHCAASARASRRRSRWSDRLVKFTNGTRFSERDPKDREWMNKEC